MQDCCYDPKLITRLKTSHIQIICGIFPTQAIIDDPGNDRPRLLSLPLIYRGSQATPLETASENAYIKKG